jgi:hypothetical protein
MRTRLATTYAAWVSMWSRVIMKYPAVRETPAATQRGFGPVLLIAIPATVPAPIIANESEVMIMPADDVSYCLTY